MAPRFRALGNELVDAFAGDGRCEFVSQFAEPYAARVIAILLGIPESEWRKIAEWGTDLGLSLSIAIREELPRIEAALDRETDPSVLEEVRHAIDELGRAT